jgi:hypothetical protein
LESVKVLGEGRGGERGRMGGGIAKKKRNPDRGEELIVKVESR